MENENVELTAEEIASEVAAGYNDDAVEYAVEEVQAVDPLAEVEAVKRSFGELSERLSVIEKLEARLRKSEGHIGDLIKKVTASQRAQENIPTKEQLEAIEAEKAKIESLKDLHGPELIEFLQERDSRIASKAANPDDVARIREELATDFDYKLNSVQQGFEVRLVSAVHPGWTEIVKQDDFLNWMKAQPREVAELAASSRAEDAIKLLNTYNRRQAPSNIVEQREQRLQRSVAPRKSGTTSRPLSYANMTPEQQRAYEIKQGYEED